MVDMTGKYYLLEDLDPEYVQATYECGRLRPVAGQVREERL